MAWERITYLAEQAREYDLALDAIKQLRRIEPEVKEWQVLRDRILVAIERERSPEVPAVELAGAADIETGFWRGRMRPVNPELAKPAENVSISGRASRDSRLG